MREALVDKPIAAGLAAERLGSNPRPNTQCAHTVKGRARRAHASHARIAGRRPLGGMSLSPSGSGATQRNSCMADTFLSLSLRNTLPTAISKSSCVTWMRRSRSANMPASVQTPLHSAPVAFSIMRATLRRSMPRMRFILRLWILRMCSRLSSFGAGNSTLRSIRPGRSSAGSRMSMRFVAMTTLMFWEGSKPSSWLRSSSIVRCTSLSPRPESERFPPMESTSSMKMMDGAFSRAMTKSSRTMRDPSPMYFCTSSEPLTRMKVQSVWCATARARSVFPVPGGPYMRIPLGWATPRASKSSGCLIGSSITSFISWICLLKPPTMSYVASGTFSTRIRLTSGSTLLGRMRCRA
mmetsp:Transcript_15463/g.58590  ORF Transcript_15463/g.58590 Transcript_15463/m.58590 type:complete len:352 (+) Transcript_15463:3276-4331(+)